ncbi:YtpR family tRNA-binding protein [Bacillus solimangrovi]|uniref:tRNA-binding protein n=1 Tax=Bacillus solimangrovi TaxID=1305675 RepID=A0A1E5LCG6_9BACI|nr:DUF4479 family protein [Bacillus solimangrovi]OEH91784.1 tRNA-binding protein [Bacillus solimangrovi]
MNAFYNKVGIGDTLLVVLKDIENSKREVEVKGSVAQIYNNETNETVGYNFFNISEEISIEANGVVDVNETFVAQLNHILEKNGHSSKIDVDFSPKFVVGYVEEKSKHPNADKLSVCTVDVGNEKLQIVCGAPNVEKDQKVVVAKVGAVMPSGMLIKEAQLRGVDSYGMICSAKELNMPNAPTEKGILVLTDNVKIGEAFEF